MEIAREYPHLREKLGFILEGKSIPSKWVIPFSLSSLPIDIRKKFPGYKEYILEIGSGWGEFAISLAEKNPSSFILAIEKKKYRVYGSLKRHKKKELSNLRWMVLNVEWFWTGVFSKESFDRVIINFPDPWPKKKQKKHRYITSSWLKELNKITTPNAIFEFASDYWEYVEKVLFLFEEDPFWENLYGKGVVLPLEEVERPITRYQKEQKERGRNLYFLSFKKIQKG